MADPLRPDDPRRLGEYELVGLLGEGGQGVVYLAHDPSGEPVAVKVLLRGDAESRARLAREVTALENVAPFCTARVLAVSLDGPRPYVVTEFVDGPSLAERVRRRGPVRGGELDRLVVGTATALAAIHAVGVVHRDFKPANVLLGPDGPRVVDFGIARPLDATTMTGALIGTPAYLAPEQVAGHAATPASDVFAWAATVVFAATGRSPFAADAIPAVLHRIVSHQPDLAEVPAPLRDLLASGLDKDPANRPTARDLMMRLIGPAAAHGPPPSLGGTAGRQPSLGELAALGNRIALGSTGNGGSPGMPPAPGGSTAEPIPAGSTPAGTTLPPAERNASPPRTRRALIGVAAVAVCLITAGAVLWGLPFGGRGAPSPPGGTPSPPGSVTAGSGTAVPSSASPGTDTVGRTLVSDTFARTVSGGFGSADSGGGWSVGVPSNGYTVDGKVGRILMPAGDVGRSAYLDTVQSQATDLSFTLACDKPPTGKGVYVSAVGRKIADAGGYRAHVTLRPGGAVVLRLRRSDARGTEYDLAREVRVPRLPAGAGEALRVRVQVLGASPTTVRGKVWKAGAPEPSWQLTTRDATPELQRAGTAGLLTFLSRSATNAPVTVTVDDLRVAEVRG